MESLPNLFCFLFLPVPPPPFHPLCALSRHADKTKSKRSYRPAEERNKSCARLKDPHGKPSILAVSIVVVVVPRLGRNIVVAFLGVSVGDRVVFTLSEQTWFSRVREPEKYFTWIHRVTGLNLQGTATCNIRPTLVVLLKDVRKSGSKIRVSGVGKPLSGVNTKRIRWNPHTPYESPWFGK